MVFGSGIGSSLLSVESTAPFNGSPLRMKMAISRVIHPMLGAFSLASAIPKGLKLSAQGCEERATLGQPTADSINPARVLSIPHIAFVKFDFVAFQQKPKL